MVVLRSTTDCAAVSSRRSSARETLISRLPVGAVTSGVMVAVDTMDSPLASSAALAPLYCGCWAEVELILGRGQAVNIGVVLWGTGRNGEGAGGGDCLCGTGANASIKLSERKKFNSSSNRCGWKSGYQADVIESVRVGMRTGFRERGRRNRGMRRSGSAVGDVTGDLLILHRLVERMNEKSTTGCGEVGRMPVTTGCL